MKKFLLPALGAIFPVLAFAGTDCWTYVPPASGTQGTISWTDSSGFENDDVGTWLSSYTQYVTWWKDLDAPTLVVLQ